ncbi:MAG: hypothetical protein V1859_01490 [archaeon]
MSVRRLTKEGRLNLMKKYLSSEAYRLIRGGLKEDLIEYEFGNYDSKKTKKIECKLPRAQAPQRLVKGY